MLEVYRNVALQSIYQYGSLEVLSYSWQTTSSREAWPTWVAKWDQRQEEASALLLPFLYQASLSTAPIIRRNLDPNTLVARGVIVGTVGDVNPILDFAQLASTQPQTCSNTTTDILLLMSRLVVQDRWQEEAGEEIPRRDQKWPCNAISQIFRLG
jgi:hypothetical protein